MRARGAATLTFTALAVLAGAVYSLPSLSRGLLDWQPAEREHIATLGPWPPPAAADPSNPVLGQAEAVAFGEALFHTTRLSRVAGLRCASCHAPWRQFTDGRRTGLGAESGDRNTPTLLNVGQQRWFGWAGANDTLWAQSIRPLLDAREMRADPAFIGSQLRTDERLAAMYRRSFGRELPADDNGLMVDLAKALAAYQATLVSERTPFDNFRDALARHDDAAAAAYPLAAQRGLRLFIGRAQCAGCHAGALFSDGRFHASAIRSLRTSGEVDEGRAAGAFRTPPLREVAATGPYMHDGSVANLCDTLRPHAQPEGTPAPALSLGERRDLVAFLLSLSAQGVPHFVEPASLECR